MKITDWLVSSPPSTSTGSGGGQQGRMSSGGSGSKGTSSSASEEGKKKHERKQNLGGGVVRTSTPTGNQHQQPTPTSSSSSSGGSKGTTTTTTTPKNPKTTTPKEGKGSTSKARVSKGGNSKRKTEAILPMNKVKVVMKSTPQIDQVGQDVVYLVTKSAELFIETLVTESLSHAGGKPKDLGYSSLADYTHSNAKLQFLQDIIPQKMRARDALREMAKQNAIRARDLVE